MFQEFYHIRQLNHTLRFVPKVMQQNSSNFQEQMLPAEQNLHTLCLHELH